MQVIRVPFLLTVTSAKVQVKNPTHTIHTYKCACVCVCESVSAAAVSEWISVSGGTHTILAAQSPKRSTSRRNWSAFYTCLYLNRIPRAERWVTVWVCVCLAFYFYMHMSACLHAYASVYVCVYCTLIRLISKSKTKEISKLLRIKKKHAAF